METGHLSFLDEIGLSEEASFLLYMMFEGVHIGYNGPNLFIQELFEKEYILINKKREVVLTMKGTELFERWVKETEEDLDDDQFITGNMGKMVIDGDEQEEEE